MKKQYAILIVAALMLMLTLSAVYARVTRADEAASCVQKPASAFSVAMVTESAVYLFSGGAGPLILVALITVIAVIIGHIIWDGF